MLQLKVTKKTVYFGMLVSFLFCFFFQLVWNIFDSDIIDGVCYAVGIWTSEAAKEVAGVYIFIIEYLLPVLAMTFCYGRIYHVLRMKV
jgi:predicted neutral ceramidase superfamily lipid hydrolase